MSWLRRLLLTFALILLMFSPVFAQEITLNPPKGKPEERLIIRGSGFKADEAIEIILKLSEHEIIGLGTTKVDLIKTDSKGNFEIETAFPAFAKPGVYEIVILGDKGSQATAKLEILPK